MNLKTSVRIRARASFCFCAGDPVVCSVAFVVLVCVCAYLLSPFQATIGLGGPYDPRGGGGTTRRSGAAGALRILSNLRLLIISVPGFLGCQRKFLFSSRSNFPPLFPPSFHWQGTQAVNGVRLKISCECFAGSNPALAKFFSHSKKV